MLQLGVCLWMLCVVPHLLASAFGALSNVSAQLASFAPLGVVCTMLVLRSDDPPGRVRLVHAFFALMAALLCLSLIPKAVDDLRFFVTPSTHYVEYLRGRDFARAGGEAYIRYVLLTIYLPEAFVYCMEALLCGLLSVGQLPPLLHRSRWPPHRSVRWLWTCMRLSCASLCVVNLLGVGMTYAIRRALGDPEYLAEHALHAGNYRAWLTLGASAAVATAISPPRLRLLLHLGRFPRVIIRRTPSADRREQRARPSARAVTALDGDGGGRSPGIACAPGEAPEGLHPALLRFVDASHRFEGLQLGERLGAGGYAEVFAAHSAREAGLAVKIFDERAARAGGVLARIAAHEIEILRQVSHPRIVEVLGTMIVQLPASAVLSYAPAIVMRNPGGGTLQGLLAAGVSRGSPLLASSLGEAEPSSAPPLPRLTPRQTMRLAVEIADGLAFLHAKRITHRDLKPSNILLTAGGEHAQIADFGLAVSFGGEDTPGVGTWRFMAPEVLFGPYDHTADVYSFGLVLWCLMQPGRVPFEGLQGMQLLLTLHDSELLPLDLVGDGIVLEHAAPLMRACVARAREARPSMASVHAQLSEMEQTLVAKHTAAVLDAPVAYREPPADYLSLHEGSGVSHSPSSNFWFRRRMAAGSNSNSNTAKLPGGVAMAPAGL